MCTLKSAYGPTIYNPNVKMGFLNSDNTCTQYNGTDIIEQDLEYRVGSEYDCCKFCKETNGCKAYTYDMYEGGICWLKSSDSALVPKMGTKTGINAMGRKSRYKHFLEIMISIQDSGLLNMGIQSNLHITTPPWRGR
jgi:hypothetical protein